MRRWWIAVLVSIACSACAREQAVAWMPELVVHARLGVEVERDARGTDWQVGASARWALARAPAPREPGEPAPPTNGAPGAAATACASPATCAWERRERARAFEAARSLAKRRR
ncbi:MAG TPA: hypothetical protein VIL20_13330 [Sandaracinaceae bacterium]